MEKPGEGANEKADSDAEKEDAAKDVPPAPPMPALGSVATIDQSDGVLLRYSKIKKDWERLGVKSVIQEGDRLAALAHSRHVLQWANSRVTLIGPFAGTIVAGKDKTSIGRIEFDLGKVAVQEGRTDKTSIGPFRRGIDRRRPDRRGCSWAGAETFGPWAKATSSTSFRFTQGRGAPRSGIEARKPRFDPSRCFS